VAYPVRVDGDRGCWLPGGQALRYAWAFGRRGSLHFHGGIKERLEMIFILIAYSTVFQAVFY
jgi:hypothetical protein